MQTCVNGHDNPEANAFCGACGSPLDSGRVTESAAEVQGQSAPENPVADRIDIAAATFKLERNTGALGNEDWLLVQFDISNKGPTDAVALQFQLEITDVFGDPVFAGHWNHDRRIPAGTKVQTDRNGGWELNRFIPEHARLMSMDRSQLRLKITPLRAAFSDGVVVSI